MFSLKLTHYSIKILHVNQVDYYEFYLIYRYAVITKVININLQQPYLPNLKEHIGTQQAFSFSSPLNCVLRLSTLPSPLDHGVLNEPTLPLSSSPTLGHGHYRPLTTFDHNVFTPPGSLLSLWLLSATTFSMPPSGLLLIYPSLFWKWIGSC